MSMMPKPAPGTSRLLDEAREQASQLLKTANARIEQHHTRNQRSDRLKKETHPRGSSRATG